MAELGLSAASDALVLYCLNTPVNAAMDLATIKQTLWRRSGDLELQYALREPPLGV